MAKRPSRTETAANTDPFGTKPVDEVGELLADTAVEADGEQVIGADAAETLEQEARQLAERYAELCVPVTAAKAAAEKLNTMAAEFEKRRQEFLIAYGAASAEAQQASIAADKTWPERDAIKKRHRKLAEELKAAGGGQIPALQNG